MSDPLAPLDELRAQLAQADTPARRAQVLTEILAAWPDLHRAVAAERRRQIGKARSKGLTWREIGDEMGIHPSSASRVYHESDRQGRDQT
ncbi:helix-turn-helix domain-containing protein [Salinispora sp. H7-4]|uniref:helix-turn-helix domain-containing protein n=1 Tax=Salinispora sp. H7-4 TaxID=2748321 RepID=UPI0015D446BD|nr:hypothetical protein [Salinispora sp. H7-4]NYT96334.1 hypothetical protein [Salinispora sp. H7-4]